MYNSKSILISILMITLLAVVVGIGTVAYFSDIETSTGNKFAAGTLDLVVNDQNPWTSTPISVSNMKPGDSSSVVIKLQNAGSIDGYVSMWIKDVTNSPGETPEPEGNPADDHGELGANIKITIWRDGDHDGVVDDGEYVYVQGAALNSLNNMKVVSNLLLGAGDTVYIGFKWEIPTDVGNEIMGDSVTFTIEFVLSQVQQ